MVVLRICSGALQVPESSMGSAVMLAGCVGVGGVCTELRPAGNKVRSIAELEMLSVSSGSLPECEGAVILIYFVQVLTGCH